MVGGNAMLGRSRWPICTSTGPISSFLLQPLLLRPAPLITANRRRRRSKNAPDSDPFSPSDLCNRSVPRDGVGAAGTAEVYRRGGDHDGRSRAPPWIHDVPEQAFFFLLLFFLQADEQRTDLEF